MKSESEIRAIISKAMKEVDRLNPDNPSREGYEIVAGALSWVIDEDDSFVMGDLGLLN